MSVMELLVWPGEWAVGSVSVECLEAMAYCKLLGLQQQPVHVRKYIFSSDVEPVLFSLSPIQLARGMPAIASLLEKKEHLHLDSHLSEKDKADLLAYQTMVKQKLVPAFNFAMWGDERNYTEVTRPTFARIVTFPCNYTVPGRLQRRYLQELSTRLEESTSVHDVEIRLNKSARECLLALSERLGTSLYIFGSRPTSLDAFLFSRLCLVMKVPFPNGNLATNVNAFSNLVEYVNRIHNKFIVSEVRKQTAPKQPSEWAGLLMSLSFATSIMLGYAIYKGILHIEFDPPPILRRLMFSASNS